MKKAVVFGLALLASFASVGKAETCREKVQVTRVYVGPGPNGRQEYLVEMVNQALGTVKFDLKWGRFPVSVNITRKSTYVSLTYKQKFSIPMGATGAGKTLEVNPALFQIGYDQEPGGTKPFVYVSNCVVSTERGATGGRF